ncbi:MAG TPA: NUDIX domain-containing protein, partial [Anaerolineales bacterium]|nr:NUDIX domain-containing protein [Anaerolineales bacterium]
LFYAENDYQRARYHRFIELAAEIFAGPTIEEAAEALRLYQSPRGYATPRVDVRAAVFQAGKLLLVRERADGGWTLPGGWADVGDTPSTAVEREVWEEAGFRVRAQRVAGVYDANRTGELLLFHAYKLVFLCEILSGEARPSLETSEVCFFDRHELPYRLSGERTDRRHLEHAFIIQADPSLPAFFD